MFALKLSNIINLLVQQPNSGFEYYHYGYRFDSVREVDNNFDRGNKVGRKYPAVQMDVPDSIQSTLRADSQRMDTTRNVRLWFDDLLDYNNQGATITKNLIEVQEDLYNKARLFVASLGREILEKDIGFILLDQVTFTPRANLGADRTITIEVTFNVNVHETCIQLQDLIILPTGTTIPNEDIERIG